MIANCAIEGHDTDLIAGEVASVGVALRWNAALGTAVAVTAT